MTPQRFDALVAAYGGEPRRWPEAERAEAEAFALANPSRSLDDARALDAVLDRHALAPPGAGLAARILAARPPAVDWRRWGAALGAGLAAACAAGVMFGVQLSETVARDLRTEAVIAAGLDGDAMTAVDLVQGGGQG